MGPDCDHASYLASGLERQLARVMRQKLMAQEWLHMANFGFKWCFRFAAYGMLVNEAMSVCLVF